MGPERQLRFSWPLAAVWAAVGASVSVGTVWLGDGGLVPAFVAATFGVWLLWNLGARRETWAFLVGGAAGPLLAMWSQRRPPCGPDPDGERVLCLTAGSSSAPWTSWVPWAVLALMLLGPGFLALLRRPRPVS